MRLSAVLSCQQFCSDSTPDKSWVLKPIDHQNYLEKVVERFQGFGLFENIYLLVGEGPEFSPYLQYSDGPVKVVQMKTGDFIQNNRYESRNWNILNEPQTDCTPVWIYQIMLGFGEEFIYEDNICHGLVSKDAVEKAWGQIQKQPDTFCGIRGLLGTSGRLFSKNFLKRKYADKLHGKPQYDIYGSEDQAIRVVDDNLDKLLGFETIRNFNVALNRKENFRFMQKFYRETKIQGEAQFREAFLGFCKKNFASYAASLPAVLRISPVSSMQDGGTHELPLELADKILAQADSIGKLNIVFSPSTLKYCEFPNLLKLLKKYNLFYILETDGSYDPSWNQTLTDSFDIVIFNLDEISVETLRASRPDLDASQIFMNLTTQMVLSRSRGVPQIGIHCRLSRDDKRSKEIIAFWKERQDYIPLISIFKVQGHLTPTVQFVRYESPLESVRSYDQAAKNKEIHLDSHGSFKDGSSIKNMDLLSYYARQQGLETEQISKNA
jgi:hypothetical protein